MFLNLPYPHWYREYCTLNAPEEVAKYDELMEDIHAVIGASLLSPTRHMLCLSVPHPLRIVVPLLHSALPAFCRHIRMGRPVLDIVSQWFDGNTVSADEDPDPAEVAAVEADLAARAMLNVYGDGTYGDAAERRDSMAAHGSAARISSVTRRAGARQSPPPPPPQPPSSLAALVMADLSATLPREERVESQSDPASARPLQTAHQARLPRSESCAGIDVCVSQQSAVPREHRCLVAHPDSISVMQDEMVTVNAGTPWAVRLPNPEPRSQASPGAATDVLPATATAAASRSQRGRRRGPERPASPQPPLGTSDAPQQRPDATAADARSQRGQAAKMPVAAKEWEYSAGPEDVSSGREERRKTAAVEAAAGAGDAANEADDGDATPAYGPWIGKTKVTAVRWNTCRQQERCSGRTGLAVHMCGPHLC